MLRMTIAALLVAAVFVWTTKYLTNPAVWEVPERPKCHGLSAMWILLLDDGPRCGMPSEKKFCFGGRECLRVDDYPRPPNQRYEKMKYLSQAVMEKFDCPVYMYHTLHVPDLNQTKLRPSTPSYYEDLTLNNITQLWPLKPELLDAVCVPSVMQIVEFADYLVRTYRDGVTLVMITGKNDSIAGVETSDAVMDALKPVFRRMNSYFLALDAEVDGNLWNNAWTIATAQSVSGMNPLSTNIMSGLSGSITLRSRAVLEMEWCTKQPQALARLLTDYLEYELFLTWPQALTAVFSGKYL